MYHRKIYLILAMLLLALPMAGRAGDDDAESFYDRAYGMYMEEGQPKAQEIIQLLTQAIDIDPGFKKAISLLGITYFGIERFEDAIEQFDRYIALDDGDINSKIYMKKAVALHILGRHNAARRILSTMRAFFQDPPKIKQEYDSYYPSIVERARKDNLTTACVVLQNRGVENLQEYIFFAIDEDNYEQAADDPDLQVMTLPQFGKTHGWMDVIAIPMSDESGTAYCVNFDWDQARGFSHLDRSASKNTSVDAVRASVQEQRMAIDPMTIPKTSKESVAWLQGETTTVTGKKIIAYRLAPSSEGE